MKRTSILFSVLCLLVLLIFWGGVISLTWFFPNTEKQIKRSVFSSQVTILKDVQGVPFIESENVKDVLRAQGLVTARDRFFQMELIRRKMSGSLSEIFGEKALNTDLWHRRLGFSQVASQAVEKMKPETREIWEAYAEGVNDYLNHETLPWELRVMGCRPYPWRAEDGLLVVLSMFEALNDPDNLEELAYNELNRQFKKTIVDFVTWDFGFMDAPVKSPKGFPFEVKVPAAGEVNFRTQAIQPLNNNPEDKEVYGSNAWVLSGKKTKSGKPLLAGDPHLNHTVPNIWYRNELKSKTLSVRGVSIPGIPGVIIGRNEKLAWSFTNSRADVQDFILLEPNFEPREGVSYLGKKVPLFERKESIPIKSRGPKEFNFWDSPWGPYIEEEIDKNLKSKRILQWTALDSSTLSELNPIELDSANSLEQLWNAMSRWGGPVQNILIATQEGQIAWGMVGKIPLRRGQWGKTSRTLSRGVWAGYVSWDAMPRLVDPTEGFIANGNQNMWPEAPEKEPWGHDWPSSARGYQLRSLLSNQIAFDAKSMGEIQNNIYSPVHVWYRDRLLETIGKVPHEALEKDTYLTAIQKMVKDWDGLAAVDSSAYTFIREFRLRVRKNCVAPFVNQVARYRQEDVENLIAKDNLVKNLLDQRPLHLLNPAFGSWDELILVSATESARELAKSPEQLNQLRWGQRNRLQVKHPFSSQLPQLFTGLLNLPERELSGDALVVRVNKPKNGASMRMVIDLSDSKNSTFSQPGGQSGYFLSPNYQDLFESWVLGEGVDFEMSRIESKQVITP